MDLLNTYRKEIDRQSDELAFKNSMIITMFIVIIALLILTYGFMSRGIESNEENKQLNAQIKQLSDKNNTLQANYSQSQRLLNNARVKLSAGYENAVSKVIDEIRSTYYIESIPLTQIEQKYIHLMGSKYDIDYELVIGLIDLESNFNKEAVGQNKYSQDYSLFQVNSLNEDWIEQELGRDLDLMDFYDNVDAGIFILNHYRDDNIYKWTTAYNRGLGGLSKYYNQHGTYKSYYAELVLERMNKYE